MKLSKSSKKVYWMFKKQRRVWEMVFILERRRGGRCRASRGQVVLMAAFLLSEKLSCEACYSAGFSQLQGFYRQSLHWKILMRGGGGRTHAQHQNYRAEELKWVKQCDFKNMHLEIALDEIWQPNSTKCKKKQFLASMLQKTPQTQTITLGYPLSPGNGDSWL